MRRALVVAAAVSVAVAAPAGAEVDGEIAVVAPAPLMPDLVGTCGASLGNLLDGLPDGFAVDVDERRLTAEWEVAAHEPRAGELVGDSLAITMRRSAPDVRGKRVDTAIELLRESGVSARGAAVETLVPEELRYVIDQRQENCEEVVVTIGTIVPDLRGRRGVEVEAVLAPHQLPVEIFGASLDLEVASQEPPPEAIVPFGTPVRVQLAPDPPPTSPPTEPTTPPTEPTTPPTSPPTEPTTPPTTPPTAPPTEPTTPATTAPRSTSTDAPPTTSTPAPTSSPPTGPSSAGPDAGAPGAPPAGGTSDGGIDAAGTLLTVAISGAAAVGGFLLRDLVRRGRPGRRPTTERSSVRPRMAGVRGPVAGAFGADDPRVSDHVVGFTGRCPITSARLEEA